MNEAETVKFGDVWQGNRGIACRIIAVTPGPLCGEEYGYEMVDSEVAPRDSGVVSDRRFRRWVGSSGRLIERDGHPVKEQGDG